MRSFCNSRASYDFLFARSVCLHYYGQKSFLERSRENRRGCILEKKAIIDELFREARVFVDDNADIKVETLSDYDKIPDVCPKCNCEMDEIYCRSEKTESDPAFDLVVLKCQQCDAMYAYWLEESGYDVFSESIKDENPKTSMHPLGKSKKHIIPQKCAAEYLMSISAQDKRSKELNHSIRTKLPALYATGLSLVTINFARNEVIEYLKDHEISSKSLTKLLAAAVYVKANSTTTNGGLWEHKGEGISERQLEEIFGTSRKTIRKWSKVFSNKRL